MSADPVIRAFLGLGANLGDTTRTLNAAIAEIERLPETAVVLASSMYRTSPVGYLNQPDFLNAVIGVDTRMSALDLVESLQSVERKLGRTARPKWHEREIDIDVLTYDEELLSWGTVVIPHPRLHERRFVLAPFAEIAPDYLIPGTAASVKELLLRCTDTGIVTRIVPEHLST